MKRISILILSLLLCVNCFSCSIKNKHTEVVATTLPVYEITSYLCQNTDISVSQLIAENVSCLHDYTLQPNQMRLVESADLLIISGAGFESFLEDVVPPSDRVVDASKGISLRCGGHHHDHKDEDEHASDPHIWLSPDNGHKMAQNIYKALLSAYPSNNKQLTENFHNIQTEFADLSAYAATQLDTLQCREIITFHDSFSYMAESYGLSILYSIEEESGSEASAAALIDVCELVKAHKIPAIFTEKSGSDRAAKIVSAETGAKIFTLDTGLSGSSYFKAMYNNIDTLKEALE